MDFKKESANLSKLERDQIDKDVKSDMLEHFYRSCPTGIVSGFLLSISLFYFFSLYEQAKMPIVLMWLFSFNILTIYSVNLYGQYLRNKESKSINHWEQSLSTVLIIYNIYYGACVLFMSETPLLQFILIAVFLLTAAAISISTVGMFKLAVICESFILLPLVFWLGLHENIYYKSFASFIILYYVFLIGMNYRSSKWLINSIKLSKMLALLTHQAHHDLLTSALNQKGLTIKINELINSGVINDAGFSLICISINRLDHYNNSYGYQTGDVIIGALAQRINLTLKNLENDKIERILTRPRYDSFVILCQTTDNAKIKNDINQIFQCLGHPFHLEKNSPNVSVSIGIAKYPDDTVDSTLILGNAYAAMFEAKQKGGNQFDFFEPKMVSKTPLSLELENDLSSALKNKEFQLHWQPVIDLHTGLIDSVEALVRWNNPKRGFISPIDFIPLAEETGHIYPLSEWIFEEAIRQAAEWHKQGYQFLKISLNLSPKQLKQEEGKLIELIDSLLNKYQYKATNLELELIETSMLNESLVPLINQLSERGITLSIDDFGTGYSGYGYLTRFHINKLKIDQSFVRGIDINSDNKTIISAIIAMAHELNIKILAEGVETKEQLDFLRSKNCQFIQGYYYSRPVKTKDFTELLKSGKRFD
ncbi:MAG: hypothetical protein JWM09_1184 [Francisellaceae bacterium]|nr:hypothetical protein [Francisellaceae bacterium]